MGCCVSRAAENDRLDPANATATVSGKPFKRAGLTWTAESPITRSQVEIQRKTFWETAPSFEGRPEIWQALEAAVNSSELSMAQSILDAANVIIPTGNPSEGCYDELGNRYVIPIYCLVDPTNLVSEDSSTSALPAKAVSIERTSTQHSSLMLEREKTSDISIAGSATELTSLIPITVRLSTAQDIKVDISRRDETVASLRTRIFMQTGGKITPQTHTIRLIYLGRVLQDTDRILYEGVPGTPHRESKSGIVHVANGAIIQALVSKR
ncbi:hypothetical protein BX666DRAFT_2023917 [Dichotomocladium elegans]|nr:hypothetical protein BX666DRAFT_2023917 [Dichotomocladium elegans]